MPGQQRWQHGWRSVHHCHGCAHSREQRKPGTEERVFKGVCSNFMARCMPPSTRNGKRTDGEESKAGPGRAPWPRMMVHVRPSTFNLPTDPSVPVVMVGPGTGIAPMRAFLQERRFLRQQGECRFCSQSVGNRQRRGSRTQRVSAPAVPGQEVGETVLFFGCRRRDEDFIYEQELLEYSRDKTLTALPLAFSREVRGATGRSGGPPTTCA